MFSWFSMRHMSQPVASTRTYVCVSACVHMICSTPYSFFFLFFLLLSNVRRVLITAHKVIFWTNKVWIPPRNISCNISMNNCPTTSLDMSIIRIKRITRLTSCKVLCVYNSSQTTVLHYALAAPFPHTIDLCLVSNIIFLQSVVLNISS